MSGTSENVIEIQSNLENLSMVNIVTDSIQKIRRNFNGLMEILRNGRVNTFTMTIELALTLSVVIFSGLLGTTQQAAMSYCMQFIYFEFIMIAAFSFSCAQELSRKLGAEQFRDAQKIARYGLLTSLVYLTPLPLLFAIYPKSLEILSGGASEDVTNILHTLVPIMSVGVILDTTRFCNDDIIMILST
jgi:MATE family multidrug resistance protein